MATENDTVGFSDSITQLLTPIGTASDDDGDLTSRVPLDLGAEFAGQATRLAEWETAPLAVGLIDCYQLSRECLITVFEGLHPNLVVSPFISIENCISAPPKALDLVIYYPHANEDAEAALARDLGAIRQAIIDVPIVVLSDVAETHQPKTIRSTLNSGANGFIPTRTTGIMIAIAALRFIKAGGTFAPLDQLLTNRQDRGLTPPEAARQNSLTTRQMAVLSLLRQGKANKIIAHELGMSESTVKIHVRNIMRKLGATNRTQVVYKARELY